MCRRGYVGLHIGWEATSDPHDIIPCMNIGDVAPEFSLPDLGGELHALRDYRGRIVILNFWSCECPHAVRTDSLLTAWCESWGGSVALLPIASNANESPADMRAAAAQRGLPLVLIDHQHRVADGYQAETTPQVFVIDPQGVLRYAGAVDDVSFGRRQPERYFLHEAVQAIMDGALPSRSTTPPYGCIIVRHALE
jgi:peroxiredoxin